MNPVEKVISQIYLDRKGAIPLYYQIEAGLEKCLVSGKLKDGDRLPNIVDIARMLNVSHATGLKAITELQRKGLLISKRGVGTVVAPSRPGATDVMMPWANATQDPSKVGEGYFSQLFEGLRAGFDQPERIFSITHMGGMLCAPQEYIASLRARRVDSVVAYRPHEDVYPLLSAAGVEMPVISLFKPVDGSPVHSVVPDVKSAITRMVKTMLKNGQNQFVYVDYARNYDFPAEDWSPYVQLYSGLQETLTRAGVPLCEQTIDHPQQLLDKGEKVNLRGPDGKPLRAGTVLVIATPHVMRFLDPQLVDKLTIVAYTEARASVQEFFPKVTFIYCGLDDVAKAATQIAMRREIPGVGDVGRVMKIQPRVLEPAAHASAAATL